MKTPLLPVLVTGGAGFIGSHLVEALVSTGHRVRVLDDLSTGHAQNLAAVKNDIDFFEGDIRDPLLADKATSGVKTVFHLAAMASVPQSLIEPDLCLSINGLGTLNIFRAASQAGVERLIYASSSAVYGEILPPHGEEMLPRPNTPYAAVKLLGENLGLFYSEQKKLSTVSLRYFNVYGPRQSAGAPDAGVIPLFIQTVKKGLAPIIYGDGYQTRDFIHVKDVVRANFLAAEAIIPKKGATYNIGSGQAVSVNEIYRLMTEGIGPAPIHAEARAGDPPHSLALVDKAIKDLNFKAEVTLKEGLSELLSLA